MNNSNYHKESYLFDNDKRVWNSFPKQLRVILSLFQIRTFMINVSYVLKGPEANKRLACDSVSSQTIS